MMGVGVELGRDRLWRRLFKYSIPELPEHSGPKALYFYHASVSINNTLHTKPLHAWSVS